MYTIDVVFFFKQKTAYEVRISDWSSDVCSSDLLGTRELMRTVGDRFLDMNSKVTKGLVQELTLPEGATGSAHAPFYIPGRKSTYDGRNPSAREIGLIADPSEGAKNIYTYDFLSQTWRLETPARPVSFPGSKLHGVSPNPAATFVCSAAGITTLRFREIGRAHV